MKKEIECNITGKVQMVMFRDFVKRNAKSLGIIGEIKNLGDGSVCLIAQGFEEELNKLIVKLNKGSMLSRVDNVEIIWRQPSQEFLSFNIVYEHEHT